MIAQAIVGGITVWTGLNPFIVGFHYVSSLLLVCVGAAFLVRLDAARRACASVRFPAGTPGSPTPRAPCSRLDDRVRRAHDRRRPALGRSPTPAATAFDAELLEHIARVARLRRCFALTVVLARRRVAPAVFRRAAGSLVLLGVELVQIAVGLYPGAQRAPAARWSASTWCSPRSRPPR